MKEDAMGGVCSAHGEMKNEYGILIGKPDGRDHSEDQGIDGIIILKWVFGEQGWRVWIGFIWFRIGAGGGLL
jgi:hypothetical protein